MKNIVNQRPEFNYRSNLFFKLFLLIWFYTFFYWLGIDHGEVVLYFNENHTPFWDVFFRYGTQLSEEFGFIFFMLALLFVNFKAALTVPIIGGVVTVVAAIFKEFIDEPRPIVFYDKMDIVINKVEGVVIHPGMASLPSGHTMAAFALFGFLALYFNKNNFLNILFLLLAITVALSRIYLFQHFTRDIIFGSIIGWVFGYLFFLWSIKQTKPWHAKYIKIF